MELVLDIRQMTGKFILKNLSIQTVILLQLKVHRNIPALITTNEFMEYIYIMIEEYDFRSESQDSSDKVYETALRPNNLVTSQGRIR